MDIRHHVDPRPDGGMARRLFTHQSNRMSIHLPMFHQQYQCMCESSSFHPTPQRQYSRQQRSRRTVQRRWNQLGKQVPLQCGLRTNGGQKIERPYKILRNEWCMGGGGIVTEVGAAVSQAPAYHSHVPKGCRVPPWIPCACHRVLVCSTVCSMCPIRCTVPVQAGAVDYVGALVLHCVVPLDV